ncbi:PDZ domain-containing protein [Candidatus Giovannonibacteria bacterium]|nr:PDZ domain-containing protein [Candidatus Giovannonibacteria bacterium]
MIQRGFINIAFVILIVIITASTAWYFYSNKKMASEDKIKPTNTSPSQQPPPSEQNERITGNKSELKNEVGIGVALRSSENNRVFVDSVLSNSPAEKSGIKAGDEIIAVIDSDKKYIKLTVAEYTKHIKGDVGTEVTLLLKRGGKIFEVKTIRSLSLLQSKIDVGQTGLSISVLDSLVSDVVVIDPSGRRTGHKDGVLVEEIPNAGFSPGSQSVEILNPLLGTYTLEVSAKHNANLDVLVIYTEEKTKKTYSNSNNLYHDELMSGQKKLISISIVIPLSGEGKIEIK